MAKHNNYDASFKQDAVEYYYDHKDHMSVKEITDSLGIAQSTLHKWVKAQAETGGFGPGSGHLSDKDKEIAQLKRKLRDAEGAIEVLKKSIGILSK